MNKIYNFVFSIFFSIFNVLYPKNKKRIVFGSWFGTKYGDNSRFLAEYLIKRDSNLELIWIGEEEISNQVPKEIKFCKKNSFKSLYYIMSASKVFVTQGYIDVYKYNVTRGSKNYVQLWHGIPLKKIGDDMVIKRTCPNLFSNLRNPKYSIFISSSKFMTNILINAFKSIGADGDNILECGQPRNDFLINNQMNEEFKESIKKKYGLCNEKMILTYMPTFRDKCDNLFSIAEIVKELGPDYLCIEKSHYVSHIRNNFNKDIAVINGNEFDSQELLLITDILITDYSSCYFDFSLLKKPIIHFVYDYSYYRDADRGMYTDLENATPGIVIETKEELIKTIQTLQMDIDENVFEKFISEYLTFERGQSCEYLYNEIIRKY